MKKRRGGFTLLEVIIASVLLLAVFGIAFMLLLSSSENVAAAQIGVELEGRAREVLNQIASDLRQSKLAQIKVGSSNGATLIALAPGGRSAPVPLPYPTGNRPGFKLWYQFPNDPTSEPASVNQSTIPFQLAYSGSQITYPYSDLQIRMPGVSDTGWTIANQKANPDSYWTRRVRYRLVMDTGEANSTVTMASLVAGTPDSQYMNNTDNNQDGRIDECAILKIEETLDAAGNPIRTNPTIICRDVKQNGFQIYMPLTGQDANKIIISLLLEKKDPKVKYKTIFKMVQTSVSLVRNN